MEQVRVIVALGNFAWRGLEIALSKLGHRLPKTASFGHGAEYTVGPYCLIGSYHPSQQNTFTRRLTEKMLDDVFANARKKLS
jgi:uracil-DNA glycosylase